MRFVCLMILRQWVFGQLRFSEICQKLQLLQKGDSALLSQADGEVTWLIDKEASSRLDVSAPEDWASLKMPAAEKIIIWQAFFSSAFYSAQDYLLSF